MINPLFANKCDFFSGGQINQKRFQGEAVEYIKHSAESIMHSVLTEKE